MRTRLLVLSSLILVAAALGQALVGPGASHEDAASAVAPAPAAASPQEDLGPADEEAQAVAALGRDVRFEPNLGQAEAGVLFVAYTADATVLLEADALTFLPARAEAPPGHGPAPTGAVRLTFVGAAPASVAPVGLRASVTHHYTGADPTAWSTSVPHYGEVLYHSILPGVDLRVYGRDGHLEFDHIIAPGAGPGAVRMLVEGAAPQLDGGDLALEAGGTTFTLAAPVAYQDIAGDRHAVSVAFDVDGQAVAYALGAYDASHVLVIDPVLKSSSYLGGPATEYAYGIEVRPGPTASTRYVYVGGYVSTTATAPSGFPSPLNHGVTGGTDGWMAKLLYDRGANAVTPVWYAFVGGSGTDYGYDLAVADNGDVLLVGQTYSTDFPTPNALSIPSLSYDGAVRHGSSDAYAFVTDTNGAALFGTYIGGDSTELGYGGGFGANGEVLVTGYTTFSTTVGSADFPTFNGPMTARPYTSGTDAFAMKIDRSTSPASVVFSTFYGGSGTEYGRDIAEAAGGVIVGGYSTVPAGSPPPPTTPGAYQTAPGSWYGAFVFKVPSAGGGSWTWATLVDFNDDDYVYDMAVDATGRPWLTGYTYSSNLPTTPTAARATYTCCSADAWVVGLSATGSSLVYASYYGGIGSDYGDSIAVDGKGNVLVSGRTYSATGFPLQNPTQATMGSSPDAFVARIAAGTLAFDFGTYHGGSGSGTDYGYAVAGDDVGQIYLSGYTSSGTFPQVAPFQATMGSSADSFLTIWGKDTPRPVITATSPGYAGMDTPAGPYQVLTFEAITLDAMNSTPGAFSIAWGIAEWTLTWPDGTVEQVTGTQTPTFSSPVEWPDNKMANVCLKLTDTDPEPYDRTATVCMDLEWLNRPPVPSIDVVDPSPVQMGTSIDVTGSATDMDGSVVAYEWTLDGVTVPGDTATLPVPSVPGTYTLELAATDDDDAVGVATFKLDVVDGPRVDFTWPAGTYIAGADTVPFQDLSTPGAKPILTHKWTFGDGGNADFGQWPPQPVPHLFSLPAEYDVTLTVHDGVIGNSTTKTITILPDSLTPMPDAYSTFIDTGLTIAAPGILANDLQPYPAPLSVLSYTQPLDSTGTQAADLVLQPDGSFLFEPYEGFLGTTTFEYFVADGYVEAGPTTVTVEVSMFPSPTALFDVIVNGHEVVFTDHSYAGHWPIEAWSWTFGDASPTSFTRHPFHEFDLTGTYPVTLTVRDSYGLVGVLTRSVFIQGPSAYEPTPGSDPPVADPGGPRVAVAGDTVVLDASASRGGALNYLWTQVGGPAVTIHGADSSHASFLAPMPAGDAATLTFQLRVHNGVEFSEPVTVSVLVHARNMPPVAHASPELVTVAPGDEVRLDGSLSLDPEGQALTHRWAQTAGPAASFVATGPTLTFAAPDVDRATSVVVQLTVDDGALTDTATAEVRIVPGATHLEARFQAAPEPAGLVRFSDDSVASVPLQYWWDFGDGSPASHLADPEHTFAAGDYIVTLKVTDGRGQWSTFSRPVTVDHAVAGGAVAPTFDAVELDDADTTSKDAPLPLALLLVGLAAAGVRRR